jgi:hypothetical protein
MSEIYLLPVPGIGVLALTQEWLHAALSLGLAALGRAEVATLGSAPKEDTSSCLLDAEGIDTLVDSVTSAKHKQQVCGLQRSPYKVLAVHPGNQFGARSSVVQGDSFKAKRKRPATTTANGQH